MTNLLEVADLKVHFPARGGAVRAVDGVSFILGDHECVGLVGESGCGKSTLGKAIVGLVKPTSGEVRLQGVEIGALSRRQLRPLRPRVQMIFQDPFASLNPRLTAGRIIEEPLIVHRKGNRVQRRARVLDLLRRVGLRPEAHDRYPHEFSGGQRQRIGIARALALDPALIICDEAVSALDVSIQAQIINLLRDLQTERAFSCLFISHDLSVVRHIADRVMVMYLGRVVEIGDRLSFWSHPLHPYTRALIKSAPRPAPGRRLAEPTLQGEVASSSKPPTGCRFHTRCPEAQSVCATKDPPLRQLRDNRFVACHFAEEWPSETSSAARSLGDTL